MPPRKIHPHEGHAALEAYRSDPGSVLADPITLATAVRFVLQSLAQQAPGRSVEIRVPPYGAVQAVEGTRHTRGTPPATVEMDAGAIVELALGVAQWDGLVAEGRVRASGERSDLRGFFPLRLLG